jgi:hypothetical protein
MEDDGYKFILKHNTERRAGNTGGNACKMGPAKGNQTSSSGGENRIRAAQPARLAVARGARLAAASFAAGFCAAP